MLLQHYIKIAFRNFGKYKLQTTISIVGLTIGLICFTYGLRWLEYETSYDGFYPQSPHIYMVYGIDKQTGKKNQRLPLILDRKLKQNFPEIKETTLIFPNYGSTFRLGDVTLEDPVECFIEENFFTFFPRTVICGREGRPLQKLDEVIVTRSFAVKYFQTPDNAIGKNIWNGYRDNMTIVSVIEDAPDNSMFNADVYELDQFERENETNVTEEKLWKLFNNKIYVLLEPNVNVKKFEQKISDYMGKYNTTTLLKVIPLTDARHTFGSELSFNISYIRTFMITGLLLLLCVFFNFTNLLLNRVYLRKQEMKLRNAVGANKKQLCLQLFTELTLLILISLLLACCILEATTGMFKQAFETSIPQKQLFTDLFLLAAGSWIILITICMPLLLSFIRSSSLLVSGGNGPKKKGHYRKVSMCLQLGICIFFLMSTFIMFRQISFMKNKDLGFDKDCLIQIEMNYSNRKGITQDISSLAMLEGFTPGGIFSIIHEPITQNEVEWEGKPLDFAPDFQVLEVGENFPEVFGIPLLKGRFVNESDLVQGEWRAACTKAVVNEEAVRVMGLSNPIGKTISIWDKSTSPDGSHGRQKLEIVGIIRNFQSASLRNSILPQVIIISPYKWNSYSYFARVNPDRTNEALQTIRQVFKKHKQQGDPSDCKIVTMTDLLKKLSTSEDASLRLFTLLTIFCTLISIFGLYSISSSSMEQRRKEIAVRKVMGASTQTIINMFFKEYLWITILANCIALPLAWLFMQNWMQQYPYHIIIQIWMYGSICLFTAVLIICTVFMQTIRAARTNPAEVIKSE